MSGLGNRILWCCVRRTKMLPFGGNLNNVTMTDLQAKLMGTLRAAKGFGELKRTAGFNHKWEVAYGPLSAERPGIWGR
jgi:hypothetical protein